MYSGGAGGPDSGHAGGGGSFINNQLADKMYRSCSQKILKICQDFFYRFYNMSYEMIVKADNVGRGEVIIEYLQG